MSEVSFVATRRNGRALCFGGFFYHINKTVDERSYWKCRTKGCKATLVTINDVINSSSGQHHHKPEDSRVEGLPETSPAMKNAAKAGHQLTKQMVPQTICVRKQPNNEISNNFLNSNKKFKSNNNNNRNPVHNYVKCETTEEDNSEEDEYSLITAHINGEDLMDSFVNHLNVQIEVDETGKVKIEDNEEIEDNYQNCNEEEELFAESSVPNSSQMMPNIDIKPNNIYFTNSYTNIEHFDIEMNNLFEVVRQSGFNSLDIEQISKDWNLWKKRYLELKRARNRAKLSGTTGPNDYESLKLQLEIALNAKNNAEKELKRVQNNLKESQNNVLALRSVLRRNLMNGSNNQCIALINEINDLKRKVSAQVDSHQSNLNEVKRLLSLDDNDLRAEFDQLAQERDDALKDNFELRQEIIILRSQLSSSFGDKPQ